MKTRRKVTYLFLFLLAISVVACTSLRSITYKTLAVGKETRTSMLTLSGDLYKKNVISENDKENIIEIARRYDKAHNEVASALLIFEESGVLSDEADLYTKLATSSEVLAELINTVEKLKEDSDGK